MSIVVGFGADTHHTAGLDLAAEIAETTGDEIIVTSVVQDSWATLHDFAGIDDEWRRQVHAQAVEALTVARDHLGDELRVVTSVRPGHSVPQALLDESRERDARLIVAGSATHGALGRIAFGSTSDRLAHSSQLPVALAPRGHRVRVGRIRRLVVAVDPTVTDTVLDRPIAELATWLGVPIEIVTFAVRSGSRSAFAAFADQGVQQAWSTLVRAHQEDLAVRIRKLAPDATVTATHVTAAARWSEALDTYEWREGDLLAVGSSRHGPLARVFIGSTATRIVHHSPVPVLLLPRSAQN